VKLAFKAKQSVEMMLGLMFAKEFCEFPLLFFKKN